MAGVELHLNYGQATAEQRNKSQSGCAGNRSSNRVNNKVVTGSIVFRASTTVL